MTRLPSDVALGHLIDALRNLHTKPRDKRAPDRTLLANIERRLATAVRRDRTGTTLRDGYPASTLAGGHATHIAGSTTENAALAAPLRDRHHELVDRACTALLHAVTQLNTLVSALDSIDQLTGTTTLAPKTCAHCTPHLPDGHTRPVHARGTVGDRLTVAVDLCEPCYFYVARTADPGQRDGQLPTPDQIRWHDQHGTWRIRVA